jgi:hypothetical protein
MNSLKIIDFASQQLNNWSPNWPSSIALFLGILSNRAYNINRNFISLGFYIMSIFYQKVTNYHSDKFEFDNIPFHFLSCFTKLFVHLGQLYSNYKKYKLYGHIYLYLIILLSVLTILCIHIIKTGNSVLNYFNYDLIAVVNIIFNLVSLNIVE